MTKEKLWESAKEHIYFYCDETTPQKQIGIPCDVCGNSAYEYITLSNNFSNYNCDLFYICKKCFLKGE